MFEGLRIEGSFRWIGDAVVDEFLIRVEQPEPVTFELEPCRDVAAMSDRPPHAP